MRGVRQDVETIDTVAGPRTIVSQTERPAPGTTDMRIVTHGDPLSRADPRWAHEPSVQKNVLGPEGAQVYEDEPGGDSAVGGSGATQNRCNDTRWTAWTMGGVAARYQPWYWNPNNVPSDIDGTGARNAATYAHTVWQTTVNDCGYPDWTPLALPYQGTTGSLPGTGRDGVNWVGFGNASGRCGGTVLGCSTFWSDSNGQVNEADIVLQQGPGLWALTQTSGRYDVEAVVVHETGHGMGLHHPCGVSNDASAYCSDSLLSMSSAHMNNTTQRHLGYGDMYGLYTIDR